MDKKIKQDWIKALCSGKYRQGQRALESKIKKKKTNYCCIGVLMNMLDLPYDYGIIRIASGLTYEQEQILVGMNDEQGKNFSEIADYIEKNL